MTGWYKNVLLLALVWGVAAAFIALNMAAPHQATNGLPVLVGKTWHLLLFGVFWFAVWGAGRAARRLVLGTRALSGPPEMDVALGVVVAVNLAFLLGALQLASGWLVKIVVVGGAAATLFFFRGELARAPARLRRWLNELGLSTALLLAVIVLLLFPVALTAAEPPFSWDALTYHLAVPKAYADAGGFVYLPSNVYASMPMGGSLFYLVPLLWDGLITANASYLVVSVLAVTLTYRLGRRWLSQFYAALGAALVAITPVFASCFAGAYSDHFQILFAAAALNVYLTPAFRESAGKGRGAITLGVFLGAAMAVKYTALAVGGAFVPVWIYDLIKKRIRIREVLLAAAVAAAFIMPWFAKAWVERGNPVFPLFYGVFGGRDFTAEQAERLMAWQNNIGMGRGWLDYLVTPYRVSVNADWEYAKFMGIYLPFLLPLAALGIWFFRRAGRLVGYGWAFVALWALGSQQLRFLGTALPALGLAAAATLAAPDRWPGPRAGLFYRMALILAVIVTSLPHFGGVILDSYRGRYYLVGQKEADFLGSVSSFYQAEQFVNAELPAGSKVLMVFTNHTLYLSRPAIYDSFFEASAFLLAAEKARDGGDLYRLARRWGATHVLVYLGYEDKTWPYYTARARTNFEDFLRRYGVVIYTDPYNQVYELLGDG